MMNHFATSPARSFLSSAMRTSRLVRRGVGRPLWYIHICGQSRGTWYVVSGASPQLQIGDITSGTLRWNRKALSPTLPVRSCVIIELTCFGCCLCFSSGRFPLKTGSMSAACISPRYRGGLPSTWPSQRALHSCSTLCTRPFLEPPAQPSVQPTAAPPHLASDRPLAYAPAGVACAGGLPL